MSSFTACVWIGMVMMSMTSRTSMTSINGVVFISTITSSAPPGFPTLMAMSMFPYARRNGLEFALFRIGDEADLQDACALKGDDRPAYTFEADILVAADM